MANAYGVQPTRNEIERQLERMLAHPMFQAQAQRADIFKFLVENALEGNNVDELDLFTRFYSIREYQNHSTKVRTTVSQLRTDLLAEYYRGDGKDDPVIIDLPAPERTQLPNGKYKIVRHPPGKAYAPEFSYNPRSAIAREFAIANYLLRGSPAQVDKGLEHLEKLFKLEADHPDVVLGTAEAIAGKLLLGMYEDYLRDILVAAFLQWIQDISPKVPDYWRVPMVCGLLYFCGGNQDAAAKEFENALKLDRQSVISRGWYTHFLFATGRHEEAVLQIGLEADERVDNSQAQALHGIYLCKTNRFKEAELVLTQALELDRNCWVAHYGMTQMYLATGKQELVYEHSKRLAELVEPWEYEDMRRRLSPEPPAR
jgi:Tfp pilus assembly protein PilF